MKLSERQKELLQEDKYSLVDMIVLLEHKLEKLVEELKFTKNEMLLITESSKFSDYKYSCIIKIDQIDKLLDVGWKGDMDKHEFIDTVTQIISGGYDEKQTSND